MLSGESPKAFRCQGGEPIYLGNLEGIAVIVSTCEKMPIDKRTMVC